MSRRRTLVKWFQRLKGYGFIESEKGVVDVFTHYSVGDENDDFRNLHHSQFIHLVEQVEDKQSR